jgi:hypothetical protein
MPPYSFQFYCAYAIDMFELRQQLGELHLGILHFIEIQHPYVIVHYANFIKDDLRVEIELKGKLFGNMLFLPYSKKIDLDQLNDIS